MGARLPPLNSLRAFEAAGRLGGFKLAAAELNVTHGAISRHVQQLEAWLGAPLFIRRHRGVELTASGAAYLREVGPSLEQLSLATARLFGRQDHRVIRVNAATTFALRWLIPQLSKFQRLHPECEVRIQTSSEPVERISGPFDVAIRGATHPVAGYRTFKFLSEGSLPFCNPKILAERPLGNVLDLARHTLLHVTPYADGWPEWLAEAGAAGLASAHSITFDDLYVAIQAAIDGLGVAVGPLTFIADELADGRLVTPFEGPLVPGWSAWRYHAYVAKGGDEDATVMAFVDWLCAAGQP